MRVTAAHSSYLDGIPPHRIGEVSMDSHRQQHATIDIMYTVLTEAHFTRSPSYNFMRQPLNHLWCQICLLFSHFSGEVFTRLHQVALHYSRETERKKEKEREREL